MAGETSPPAEALDAPPPQTSRILIALILGQVAVHAAMSGQRMAAPLQALEAGHNAWAVGLLLALFAALPVATAMSSGRMADRHGYHRPVRVAVALTMAGAAMALAACWLPQWWRFALLCVAAASSGVGTNLALIAIQRTAGHLVNRPSERVRIFSWLGMAPALANVVGPVLTGFMIDASGFAGAYAVLMLLPLATLWFARGVPVEAGRAPPVSAGPRPSTWDLLRLPGVKRLLVVNWLLSASWDVHSFAVPVLGHARSYNASTIGLVLGTFTLAVTAVRFIIPMIAHRLEEVKVLTSAMVLTGLVFAAYPFAKTPWMMGVCAMLLGLTLGAVQPMVMSALHHLTPAHRHGEALAFRSMAMNASSSIMPLGFGLVGTALGPGVMFWIMGLAVASGSWVARGLRATLQTREGEGDGPGP